MTARRLLFIPLFFAALAPARAQINVGLEIKRELLVGELASPRRATLPIAGGLLFAVLIGVWWTSARWFFDTVGIGL